MLGWSGSLVVSQCEAKLWSMVYRTRRCVLLNRSGTYSSFTLEPERHCIILSFTLDHDELLLRPTVPPTS